MSTSGPSSSKNQSQKKEKPSKRFSFLSGFLSPKSNKDKASGSKTTQENANLIDILQSGITDTIDATVTRRNDKRSKGSVSGGSDKDQEYANRIINGVNEILGNFNANFKSDSLPKQSLKYIGDIMESLRTLHEKSHRFYTLIGFTGDDTQRDSIVSSASTTARIIDTLSDHLLNRLNTENNPEESRKICRQLLSAFDLRNDLSASSSNANERNLKNLFAMLEIMDNKKIDILEGGRDSILADISINSTLQRSLPKQMTTEMTEDIQSAFAPFFPDKSSSQAIQRLVQADINPRLREIIISAVLFSKQTSNAPAKKKYALEKKPSLLLPRVASDESRPLRPFDIDRKTEVIFPAESVITAKIFHDTKDVKDSSEINPDGINILNRKVMPDGISGVVEGDIYQHGVHQGKWYMRGIKISGTREGYFELRKEVMSDKVKKGLPTAQRDESIVEHITDYPLRLTHLNYALTREVTQINGSGHVTIPSDFAYLANEKIGIVATAVPEIPHLIGTLKKFRDAPSKSAPTDVEKDVASFLKSPEGLKAMVEIAIISYLRGDVDIHFSNIGICQDPDTKKVSFALFDYTAGMGQTASEGGTVMGNSDFSHSFSRKPRGDVNTTTEEYNYLANILTASLASEEKRLLYGNDLITLTRHDPKDADAEAQARYSAAKRYNAYLEFFKLHKKEDIQEAFHKILDRLLEKPNLFAQLDEISPYPTDVQVPISETLRERLYSLCKYVHFPENNSLVEPNDNSSRGAIKDTPESRSAQIAFKALGATKPTSSR